MKKERTGTEQGDGSGNTGPFFSPFSLVFLFPFPPRCLPVYPCCLLSISLLNSWFLLLFSPFSVSPRSPFSPVPLFFSRFPRFPPSPRFSPWFPRFFPLFPAFSRFSRFPRFSHFLPFFFPFSSRFSPSPPPL